MKKLIVFSLAFSLLLTGCSLSGLADMGKAEKVLSIEEAQAEAERFINENLMSPGNEASIAEITEEGNLYKVMVDIGTDKNVESYLSKDGKKFFPTVFDVEEIEKEAAEQKATKEAAATQANMELEKTEVPAVELFVMSYCPYGTQMEKGILPVIETLGNKIDFKLKFCDYSMHGKKELDEQLNQYCIQKNEPNKLLVYLKCFLEDGDSQTCLATAGVDVAELNSCVDATDKDFKVTEQFNDKSTWRGGTYPLFGVNGEDNVKYGVGGSPTLVINGKVISSARDSQSLLNTICGAFSETPEECSAELSGTSPTTGFGWSGSGASTAATCN